MEVITSVNACSGIVTSCRVISRPIIAWISAYPGLEGDLVNFKEEIITLRDVAASTRQMIRDHRADPPLIPDKALWKRLQIYSASCEKVVTVLEGYFSGLEMDIDSKVSSIGRRSAQDFSLVLQQGELKQLREQIRLYGPFVQLSMQAIVLQSQGPYQEVDDQMDIITADVARLTAGLQDDEIPIGNAAEQVDLLLLAIKRLDEQFRDSHITPSQISSNTATKYPRSERLSPQQTSDDTAGSIGAIHDAHPSRTRSSKQPSSSSHGRLKLVSNAATSEYLCNMYPDAIPGSGYGMSVDGGSYLNRHSTGDGYLQHPEPSECPLTGSIPTWVAAVMSLPYVDHDTPPSECSSKHSVGSAGRRTDSSRRRLKQHASTRKTRDGHSSRSHYAANEPESIESTLASAMRDQIEQDYAAEHYDTAEQKLKYYFKQYGGNPCLLSIAGLQRFKYMEGSCCFEQGRYDDTVKHLRDMIKEPAFQSNPVCADAYDLLAKCYMELREKASKSEALDWLAAAEEASQKAIETGAHFRGRNNEKTLESIVFTAEICLARRNVIQHDLLLTLLPPGRAQEEVAKNEKFRSFVEAHEKLKSKTQTQRDREAGEQALYFLIDYTSYDTDRTILRYGRPELIANLSSAQQGDRGGFCKSHKGLSAIYLLDEDVFYWELRLLLEDGADPSSHYEFKKADGGKGYRSVLRNALRFGDSNIARLLLKFGANPNAILSDNRFSLLHHAAREDRPDVAELLLQKGADLQAFDCDGFSPLHISAVFGCPKTCRVLLEGGADPRKRTRDGSNARELAEKRSHKDIVALLDSRRANGKVR